MRQISMGSGFTSACLAENHKMRQGWSLPHPRENVSRLPAPGCWTDEKIGTAATAAATAQPEPARRRCADPVPARDRYAQGSTAPLALARDQSRAVDHKA